MSRCAQAAEVDCLSKIDAALELTTPPDRAAGVRTTEPIAARIHSPEEEIALGPAAQTSFLAVFRAFIRSAPTPPCAVFYLATVLIGG